MPRAPIPFRSAHAAPPFLDTTRVGPARTPLSRHVGFGAAEAQTLSRADRVHTFASFPIAVAPETA